MELSQVGRFKIVDKLGAGVLGEVVKVRDQTTGELRAIKLFKPQVISASGLPLHFHTIGSRLPEDLQKLVFLGSDLTRAGADAPLSEPHRNGAAPKADVLLDPALL